MHSIRHLCCLVAALVGAHCHSATLACEVAATGPRALIGSIGGERDAVLFAGYQVMLLSDGRLAVHDPVKGRLLVFARLREAFNCTDPVATVELKGAPISAIAQHGGVIYGVDLTGAVIQLYPTDTELTTGEATGSAATAANEVGKQQPVLTQFAVSHPLRRGKAIWPGVVDTGDGNSRVTGEIGLSPDDNRLVSVPNGTILIGKAEHRHAFLWRGSDRGTLTIWRRDSPQAPLELPIAVPGILGAVDILRATSSGFMIVVESVDLDKGGRVRVEDHYFAFSAQGGLQSHRVSAVPMPNTSGRWTPMDTPAQSDPLDENLVFYFYRSKNALVSVATDLRQARDATHSSKSSVAEFDNPDPRRAILIKRANEFLDAPWRAESTNLNASNPTWNCLPPYTANANRWAQPIFLRNVRPGAEIYGVPYLWGGKAGWKDYIEKMKAGGIAGNVCTKVVKGEAVAVPGAAGIDCSGFISRVWELGGGRHRVDLSTSALSTNKYSRRLASLTDLQPGDILNKASAHVRLFAGWVRTPFGLRIRSYESTTDSVCSGTCMRDMRVRAYVGYVPRGFPG